APAGTTAEPVAPAAAPPVSPAVEAPVAPVAVEPVDPPVYQDAWTQTATAGEVPLFGGDGGWISADPAPAQQLPDPLGQPAPGADPAAAGQHGPTAVGTGFGAIPSQSPAGYDPTAFGPGTVYDGGSGYEPTPAHGTAAPGAPFEGTPAHGTPYEPTPAHGVPYDATPAHGTDYPAAPPYAGGPYAAGPYPGTPYQSVGYQGTPAYGVPAAGYEGGAGYDGSAGYEGGFDGVFEPAPDAGFDGTVYEPAPGRPDPGTSAHGFPVPERLPEDDHA
ncbi:hypothetical protein ACQRUO_32210, partial [Kitasatospora sp. LaBMicrA B282]